VNSAGPGAGAYATATPHVFPPGPPTNLAATQGPNAGDITISWTPPTYNGSSPDGSSPAIDYYTVKVSPGAISARIDAPNTLYVAHNTADNITYTFSVTATNHRNVTGAAAVVYSPYPGGASIGLQPSAGTATTAISVTGQLFLKNESITLYWDTTNHVAGTVVTDDNGSFTKVVKMYSGAKTGTHALYANVQPKPHANFALQVTPTPTPTTSPGESPSPSSTETPQASGPRTGGGGGGGISGLDILTRPPFVFLPIIGILGLLGVLIYWAVSSRRRPMAPSSASVVHHATRPDYMEPFPSTPRSMPVAPSASSPVAPVQPAQPPPAQSPPPGLQGPPAFERPPVVPTPPAFQPPPAAVPPPAPQPPPQGPVQWPAPPNPAAAPDEPPDFPEPSD
jgi:hypothetical protein